MVDQTTNDPALPPSGQISDEEFMAEVVAGAVFMMAFDLTTEMLFEMKAEDEEEG